VAVAVLIAGATAGISLALFTDTAQIRNSAFSTDTLNAPTGLSATGGVSANLSWTGTSDTYATGHRVFRATTTGGPYSQIAQVTPRTTTTYSDSSLGAGTFFYVVVAYYQSWESANSNEISCTKVVTVVTC